MPDPHGENVELFGWRRHATWRIRRRTPLLCLSGRGIRLAVRCDRNTASARETREQQPDPPRGDTKKGNRSTERGPDPTGTRPRYGKNAIYSRQAGDFSNSQNPPQQPNGGGASNATTHRAATPRDLQLFGGAQERFTRDKRGDFQKFSKSPQQFSSATQCPRTRRGTGRARLRRPTRSLRR